MTDMCIKVKFIRNDKPQGREYTYRTDIPVEVGSEVILPGGGACIVTEINVLEESVEGFMDKVKKIEELMEETKWGKL